MTTSLLFNVIIVITLLLQVAAVIYALRLVRRTKYNVIWALCVIGFVLIACERYFELRSINSGGESYFYISIGLGLAVSVCISFAVFFAHRLVNYLDRVEMHRSLLNRRILTAVIRAEERARSSFSKDMHDGLGPLLSSAKMSLSALPTDNMTDKEREIIKNTSYVIDEAIRSVREISNSLSPQVLIDFGLAQAIKNFINRVVSLHGVGVDLHIELPSERLDTDVEVIIYRVVCELTHNSLKHSGCNLIALELLFADDIITLHYADNGQGFDIKAVEDHGMGLSNITSRINSVGGHIDMQSSKGEGMNATITIPVNGRTNG